jgi:glycosyltransferase involved in cell wall biosynthesis
MACGTPVVAANNSSIPEIVGDSAELVDNICYDGDCTELANKLCSVLSNPEHLEFLSLKGLERVKKFSWDRCAEETLKTYELMKSTS